MSYGVSIVGFGAVFSNGSWMMTPEPCFGIGISDGLYQSGI